MKKLLKAGIFIYLTTIIAIFCCMPRYDIYITAPLKNINVTSQYGMRWGKFHRGIDLAAAKGDKVYSAAGGEVIKVGNSGSYGKLVVIRHSSTIVTYYAHLDKIHVKKGEKITRNTVIGTAGSSGNATGVHLHFEIRIHGKAKNPAQFIDKHGIM